MPNRQSSSKRQEWMHQALNPERALQAQQNKGGFDWEKYVLPGAWKRELAHFFSENLVEGEVKHSEQNILHHLTRLTTTNTSGAATSAEKTIADLLKIIYAIFLKKISPAKDQLNIDLNDQALIQGIVTRLVEGLPNCSNGMAERLQDVVSQWRGSDSFSDMLCNFRKDIITSLARRHFSPTMSSMETHFLNFYCVVANEEMGLNLSGVVKDAHYAKTARGPYQLEIATEMKERYTPLGMVQYIEERVKQNISILTPKRSGECYSREELTKHNDQVKNTARTLLSKLGCDITKEDNVIPFLISKEEVINQLPKESMTVYIDINWPKIRNEVILERLFEKGILTKPKETKAA